MKTRKIDSMTLARAILSKKPLLRRAAMTIYLDRQARLVRLRRVK